MRKLVTASPTECHGGPDCRISQVVDGPIPRLPARRFTVRERIGQQLPDALEPILAPNEVAVHVEIVPQARLTCCREERPSAGPDR